MGEADVDVPRREGRYPGDPATDVVEVLLCQDAVVEGNEEYARSVVGRRHRAEGQRGRRQRAVDAGRAVVSGGAPHAVVDPYRRRDVAAGDADAAVTLGRVDVGHRSALLS